MKFGVVSELLSDISFQDKKNTMQVTMIPRNKIIKNSRNGYAITGIEELAADIKRSGLAQPLEVMELPDGTYRQITGERSVVPQIKRNSILHIIRDCFCDVSMNNSRLFDADSSLYFI